MEDQPNWHANIVDKVKPPGIGLIIYGALGMVSALSGVVFAFYGATISEQLFERFSDAGEPVPDLAETFGAGIGLAFNLAVNVLNLAAAAFVIYAGLRMIKLRDHGICIAGAIVALVVALVPCVGICCLIGLPIGLPVGIWALVVLNRADVRAAFEPST